MKCCYAIFWMHVSKNILFVFPLFMKRKSNKFSNFLYPCFLTIQKKWLMMNPTTNFHSNLSLVDEEDVTNFFDRKRSTLRESVPTSIVKAHSSTYLLYLTNIIKKCVEDWVFSDELKLAEIVPIYKKGNLLDKGDSRPVSLFSHVSRIFGKTYVQIASSLSPKFRICWLNSGKTLAYNAHYYIC